MLIAILVSFIVVTNVFHITFDLFLIATSELLAIPFVLFAYNPFITPF